MTDESRRLVVLGAGGRTGRLILDSALRQGHQAVAVVRSVGRAGLEPRDGLEIAVADASDAGSLTRILCPGDALISAIGPSGRKSNGLYASVAEAVVDAASASGADRFVGITSSGVRADDPHHPWWYRTFLVPLMRNTYADMERMESIIAQSSIDWTFVRPGRLLDEAPTGSYRVEDGANPSRGLVVPRGDIADFVVRCAAGAAWSRQHPTIAR